MPSSRGDADVARLGAVVFVLLAVLSVASFAVTRAVRASDDIVNTVELQPELEPGGQARIAFTLAEGDARADVLIVELDGTPVRALVAGQPLEPGVQVLAWDGRDGDGNPVDPGHYGLEVVLGEQDREIRPPGTIRVLRGRSDG